MRRIGIVLAAKIDSTVLRARADLLSQRNYDQPSSILLEMLAWSVPDSGEVGTLWSHTASQPPCMGSQKGEKDSSSISFRQVGPFSRKSCMRPLSVLKGLMQLLPLPKIFLAQFQRAAGV